MICNFQDWPLHKIGLSHFTSLCFVYICKFLQANSICFISLHSFSTAWHSGLWWPQRCHDNASGPCLPGPAQHSPHDEFIPTTAVLLQPSSTILWPGLQDHREEVDPEIHHGTTHSSRSAIWVRMTRRNAAQNLWQPKTQSQVASSRLF